ncbi:MAG: uncharacterized protein JWR04_201 [Rhodoglobus sp.]|nr:uncharacterized protein [Rhodoglobus sp.]
MTVHRPAAVVLAAASILLAGCSVLGGAGGGPTPTPTASAGVDVLDLAVGDCLQTGDARRVTKTVPVVDCAEPHDSEAYAVIELSGDDFPGAEAVTDRAVTECTAKFTAFVGLDYATSTLDFAYYFPTPTSWKSGDREILCLAIDPASATVTGSLAGAAR